MVEVVQVTVQCTASSATCTCTLLDRPRRSCDHVKNRLLWGSVFIFEDYFELESSALGICIYYQRLC
jgi:hypothetical protein